MGRLRKYFKGDRFEHLTLTGHIEYDHTGKHRQRKQECICDCGRIVFKEIGGLKRGLVINCAHLECPHSRREKHGRTTTNERRYSNGKRLKTTKEYLSWCTIKTRCYAVNSTGYSAVGAVGITMSPAWKDSFHQFNKDMGDAPTKYHRLTRIDKSGDYEKDNLEWRAPKRVNLRSKFKTTDKNHDEEESNPPV